MSSLPGNVDNRLALERVLEKTLEDTQRDVASFRKARDGSSGLDARSDGRRERRQPGEDDQTPQQRERRQPQGQAAEPPKAPLRLVPNEAMRMAAPGAARADGGPARPGRSAAPAVLPQAFLTPGHVAAPAEARSEPAGTLPLNGPMGDPGRPRPGPSGWRQEPSLAERVIMERRSTPDWPPVAAPVMAMPPQAAGGPLLPRLSAAVPRPVRARIDEYYRTGMLSEEPFSFDPVDPMPPPYRQPQLPRSGVGPSDGTGWDMPAGGPNRPPG